MVVLTLSTRDAKEGRHSTLSDYDDFSGFHAEAQKLFGGHSFPARNVDRPHSGKRPQRGESGIAARRYLGQTGCELLARLENEAEPKGFAHVLASAIPADVSPTPLQQAIRAIEVSRGAISLDRAADLAGVGLRQFRRRCEDATALSPKTLARIVRFRRAKESIDQGHHSHAELAFACGYADQSHLIAEFRRFAGKTPRKTIRQQSDA